MPSPAQAKQRQGCKRFVSGGETKTAVAQNTQAQVTGILRDATQVDLTARSKWTVYRTSNPGVATVGQDGLVVAQGRGAVYMTAVNEGATSVARVFVLPDDPLTTVEGYVRFEDGTPVNGANISLFALPQTAVADASGHFVMPNVPTQATSSLTVRTTRRVGTQDLWARGLRSCRCRHLD